MPLFGRRDRKPQDEDQKRRKQAAEAERSALLFLQGRLFGQAEVELRRAVTLDPMSPTAHAYLGMVLQRLGRLVEAEEELLLAITITPEDDALRGIHGTILGTLGRLDEACDEYQMALDLNPSNAPARAALGAVLVRRGELDTGEAQLRQALELEPRDPVALADLAEIRHRRKDLPGAIETLRKAVALLDDQEKPAVIRIGAMPGPSEAQVATCAAYQHRLGLLLQEADDLPAALAALRAAFDALPSDAKLLADLARVLIRQSRITEALALYERMEKAYPEHHARYEADLAAAIAESGLTPGRSGVPVPRSTSSPKMIGEPDGAIGAGADLLAGLEARLRSEPANRALRRELSVAYLRAGRVAEAKEQARLAEQLLGQRSAGEAKQPAG